MVRVHVGHTPVLGQASLSETKVMGGQTADLLPRLRPEGQCAIRGSPETLQDTEKVPSQPPPLQMSDILNSHSALIEQLLRGRLK